MTPLARGAFPERSLLLALGIPLVALALVLTGWAIGIRKARPQKRSSGPEVKAAALAAAGCTAYSADTSWAFAADYLGMAGTTERAALFGVAELALFATALMARHNLTIQGAPGLPGALVWVITCVQVIPAYAESGPVGGTVRAFVGPVMAAVLWHQAMGIELRLRTPGAASHGLIATLGRQVRERLLSRLGLAARDRDAAQITRDRATARAVTLTTRLSERTPGQRQSRRGRRLTRRLSKAISRSGAGTDPGQRAKLLDQLAACQHALTLATVPLPSPWSPRPDSTTTIAVPAPGAPDPSVPGGRSRAHDHSQSTGPGRGRGPDGDPGPVPVIQDRDTGPGGDDAGTSTGTKPPEGDAVPGTGPADAEAPAGDTEGVGTEPPAREVPAQGPDAHRGPTAAESGTEPTGDRGPTHTDTGTEPTGDRGPTHTDTGTEPTGDRGHKVPLRRKPTAKTRANSKGKRSRSRTPQIQRPPREPEQSVDQLVQQVRPHVPALLARDGNESVTRVQLREILRREGLKGGRNDRLSLVLQELRSDETAKTRSTTL